MRAGVEVACRGAARRRGGGLRQLGQAEVENLRAALVADEDVRRLDIAVDDALGVCRIQRVGELDGDLQQVGDPHRTAIDAVAEALAPEYLHHDIGSAFVVADVENCANPGMAQRAGGSRLDTEAVERLTAGDRLRGKELERDLSPEAFVLGEIHDSHAAGAKRTEDLVVRDRATDHVGDSSSRMGGMAVMEDRANA